MTIPRMIIMHGDGATDDIDALEALIAGSPVRMLNPDNWIVTNNGVAKFSGGNFAISRPLLIQGCRNINLGRVLLYQTTDFDGEVMVILTESKVAWESIMCDTRDQKDNKCGRSQYTYAMEIKT